MSEDLRDLLHRLAAHETAAAAVTAPDTRTEVRHVMTGIRTRRARRAAVVGAAAVTVLAAGVATATALTPAPQDPAVVDPVPTTTPTTAPTAPSPTPSATPEATEEPVRWGLVDSLAEPPAPSWTLETTAVTPGTELGPSSFVDVLSGAPYGDLELIRVGDVVVTTVTAADGGYVLTGVDLTTGEVLWVDDSDAGGGRSSGECGGATPEGLVACRAGTSGSPDAVELVDPADGTVVRTFPLPFVADSLGVAGSTIVVHGTTDGTTARWDGLDAATGAVLWSHAEPGAASDEEVLGDVFAHTVVREPYAQLFSYGYAATIDTRTGERAPVGAPALDAAVWAPAEGAIVPSFTTTSEDLVGGTTTLRATDPATGAELWVYEAKYVLLVGVVGDGALVAGDRSLTLVDLATGAVRWTLEDAQVLATDGERLLTYPYEGSDLSARSLADGSVVWSLPGSTPWLSGGWVDRTHVAVSTQSTAWMYGW